jgi:hypothetical protein
LLLDGHESYMTNEFKLKAIENHIKLFFYIYLIYILQLLDIGIFCPWKHYYKLVIQNAIRSLDFKIYNYLFLLRLDLYSQVDYKVLYNRNRL